MSRCNKHFFGWGAGLLLTVPLLLAAGCGTESPGRPDGSGDVSVQEDSTGDASAPPDRATSDVPRVTCGTFGQACVGGSGCCSGICGPNSTCEANPTSCT